MAVIGLFITLVFKALGIFGGGMEYKLFHTSFQTKSGSLLECV